MVGRYMSSCRNLVVCNCSFLSSSSVCGAKDTKGLTANMVEMDPSIAAHSSASGQNL